VILGPEHAAIIARGNLERFCRNHPARFSNLGPEDRIPVVDRPEDLLVVVAGGKGRHSMVIPTFGEHCRAATVAVTDSAGNPIRPLTPAG
jgi:hypothetical protein